MEGDVRNSVGNINRQERWITILTDDPFGFDDTDSFVHLVKSIRDDINGDIQEVGDMQYSIKGDPCNLIYQWDGCFGISIVYPKGVTEDTVLNFLGRYMNVVPI